MEKYTLEGLWEEYGKHIQTLRTENNELKELAKEIYKAEEKITLNQLLERIK